MIGIIPSSKNTFEIFGDFNSDKLVEGKLYYDPLDERLYFYSTTEMRPNPKTGFFPVWDGRNKYSSKFANEKYFKDAVKLDMLSISNSINKDVADAIRLQHKKCDDSEILQPIVLDGDNMFTQCVKGVILSKKITLTDLVDMTNPRLDRKIVENMYTSLTKISFMRFDKWNVWVDVILHVRYHIDVYKGDKILIKYDYPNTFDTGIVKYSKIVNNAHDDQFKKIVKILIIMENINKSTFKGSDMDDYTVNNMFTAISSNHSLSAQLFSRFIEMAELSYEIIMIDHDKEIFRYKE